MKNEHFNKLEDNFDKLYLAPKPFEIQFWDWSRMKENLKIAATEKCSDDFFSCVCNGDSKNENLNFLQEREFA